MRETWIQIVFERTVAVRWYWRLVSTCSYRAFFPFILLCVPRQVCCCHYCLYSSLYTLRFHYIAFFLFNNYSICRTKRVVVALVVAIAIVNRQRARPRSELAYEQCGTSWNWANISNSHSDAIVAPKMKSGQLKLHSSVDLRLFVPLSYFCVPVMVVHWIQEQVDRYSWMSMHLVKLTLTLESNRQSIAGLCASLIYSIQIDMEQCHDRMKLNQSLYERLNMKSAWHLSINITEYVGDSNWRV